ncbi:MAG: glycoside hydrolase family 15 protein [Deltaproteobacteria bacterium]
MKSYFNDAIIGNSKMLGCIGKNGELIRLLWPYISYSQHIDSFYVGIKDSNKYQNTSWFHEDSWTHNQQYIDNTNILITSSENYELGYRVVQTDFILIEKDVLVRKYTIQNIGQEYKNPDLFLYSSMVTNSNNIRSSLFNFNTDTLVQYKHNNYFSISSDLEIKGFQLNNSYDCVLKGELYGFDDTSMSNSAALKWHLGEIEPGEKKDLTLYLYADSTLNEALEGIKSIKDIPVNDLLDSTAEYWRGYITQAKGIKVKNKEVLDLYNRTILTFALMSEKDSGGILAAPEIDEEFTRCGRYGYCWGRDAAFIVSALDKCELFDLSDKFFEWTFKVRAEDNSWYQRYYTDGNLAPSWGIQIDEIGSIIWGIWEHYKANRDIAFLEKAWRYVTGACEFLIEFIDKDTGLPRHTYDLWEERTGEHAYSSAAVYGGLVSAVKIAEVLGCEEHNTKQWKQHIQKLKNSIEKNFWDGSINRFLRSVQILKNPWEISSNEQIKEVVVNKKGYKRQAVPKDDVIDVSLIGLSVPFDVFPVNNKHILSTVEAIEQELAIPGIGGLKRYCNDNYIGGNPWIISTLWLALYHIKAGQIEKAKGYFNWAVKHRTKLGFLPEQIDKNTGEAAWVIPLTWSHAMFIIVLFELMEMGEIV